MIKLVPLTRGTLFKSTIFKVRSNLTRFDLRLNPLIFAGLVVPPGEVARGVCGTGRDSLEDGAGDEALLEEECDLRRKREGMWSTGPCLEPWLMLGVTRMALITAGAWFGKHTAGIRLAGIVLTAVQIFFFSNQVHIAKDNAQKISSRRQQDG